MAILPEALAAALEVMLALLLLLMALACLVDRYLRRACRSFVCFAVLMALTWWQLRAPWLAAVEAVLGALLTGFSLFFALGFGAHHRLPRRDTLPGASPSGVRSWLLPLTWWFMAAAASLLLVDDVGTRLSEALAVLGPLALVGLAIIGLGLWGFVRHRHLLRRLLAFNVLGSGIFLVLAEVAGPRIEAQALILTGLIVALFGSLLGASLIRRLFILDGRLALGSGTGGKE
ncbi:NADH-quinone oxidoreductase subunit K [Halomonas korlensis]|uniref:Uncharacterized protein n=1 Tax=Halomonas korlensis TaxID=463301 RepID=A0A1I7G281_9GAMM|nr:NADH-quinone oxidoreductase subunit K [Halomonas korlensis]SFU42574.1 hypothetical protein SAMN04487955_102193 [Halomonas korlensis]